ncbi:radical SAM additional 4Fe4S-binding SPASM domain-containing protein [Desulfotomaculum arcticum]|uniref:Radical SAM additional 4Fe4S-binding SPASM domain-containing protein n=1 Tax=Desulfotruncus arcticus DSM 17038 TaxID=1121424 RepID=A0A1I2VXV7_9FIRM|nr:radical SAM protein [Desulfotruncus arcticus]SFG94058.1 radical SAM additional 4Fe4S-binding SPASM domain-containing protein [Desulfotomaculum arcticum] [Desulfotruncus arcticus DSM 17038]
MEQLHIDPVNKALIELTDSQIMRRLVKLVLANNTFCPQCGGERAWVAVGRLLGSGNALCPDCRALADRIRQEVLELGPVVTRVALNTLKGVLSFGLRRPFVAGAPRLVTWEFTSRCNLASCPHCYTDSVNHCKYEDELSTEEALQAVDSFTRAGVTGIAFTGGEALLRDDFFQVAGYAVSRGIPCYVATNGSPLTGERVRSLKEAGVSLVHVSMDSPDPAAHDAFRGTPGLHRMAVEGIKRCVEAGLQVSLAATATKKNWADIPKLLDFGDELGADWLLVYNFIPTGRGTAILDPSPEEREELFRQLWKRSSQTRRIRVSAFAPQFGLTGVKEGCSGLLATHYLDPVLFKKHQSIIKSSAGCMAGKNYLAMEPNGRLKPCTFLPVHIGNIRQDNLERLWLNSPVLAQLRDPDCVSGSCRYCRFQLECGGCRARAYACTGDYLGSDPGCVEGLRAGASEQLNLQSACAL